MSRPYTFYGPPSLWCKSLPYPCAHLHNHAHTYIHTQRDTHTLNARSTTRNTEQKLRAEAHKHITAHNVTQYNVHVQNVKQYFGGSSLPMLPVYLLFLPNLKWQLCCYIGTVCISPFFAFVLSQVLSRGAGNEEEPQIQHVHNRVLMVSVKSFVFTNHCATDAFSIFCEHIRILRFTV